MPAAPRVRSALSRSLDRALVLVALLALMLVVVELALFPLTGPAGPLLVMLPAIFAVYVIAGLIAWKRRPSNGMGFLIVVAGFALYLGTLQNTGVPVLVGIGAVCATIVAPALVHLLLAFPTGRLPDRTSKLLVASVYVVSLVFQAPLYLLDPQGPFPPFAVADLPRVAELFGLFQTAVATALSVGVAVVLWGRLRRADAAHRRVLIPLFSYGIFAVLFMPLIAIVLDRVLLVHPYVRGYIQFAVLAGVPIAFALGTLRGGFARTGELEELGTWLGTASASKEPLTTALAHALGDPSLRLYFWAGDRGEFLDADGRVAPARTADSRRGWEKIMLDGRIIGAIDYDSALLADRKLVRTAGRIVAIEVERARLTAELRASQRALMQSRERLVEAADRERRRIARDLHDGLQVRLVLLALEAQQLATAPSAAVPERATRLRVDIDAAAADVRTLVRDLVPAALVERGLAAAAEDLADRMPIPTQFESDVEDGAIGDLVEATTYFVLTEALANVVKHAHATLARVRLAVEDGRVHLDVEDDGVGGASMGAGSGLRGLADRVEAIGGVITISSPRGKGTRVQAEVPCA
ncbi:sensor histidine kinase [Microbacterium sp. CFH 90308]|uniref:Sensor histidine kinase n=1 Tax=Microbacterium salsuginis TaxID=2722803 RepID=A0ABX1KCC9_9MICO|nr:histidine kinase [Microbacterium sp. CFH 90308]NLP84688.1 sensor histidine kinase [Microbacterium sp. CFH 90308]